MLSGEFSQKLQSSIVQAYKELCGEDDCEVAVRSSATAEDLNKFGGLDILEYANA